MSSRTKSYIIPEVFLDVDIINGTISTIDLLSSIAKRIDHINATHDEARGGSSFERSRHYRNLSEQIKTIAREVKTISCCPLQSPICLRMQHQLQQPPKPLLLEAVKGE